MGLNKYSKTVTQDPTQPAAQAMLYGIGLNDTELAQPFIGIASMGYDGNTCNMHLNHLASYIKVAVNATEMVGLIFNTIGISDGITNGTDGMRYSLVSREIIADSIESVVAGHYYDYGKTEPSFNYGVWRYYRTGEIPGKRPEYCFCI